MQAAVNAYVTSLGALSGSVRANGTPVANYGSAIVTAWSDLSGSVSTTGPATVDVNGNLSGSVTAGTDATADVVGDATGPISAGRDASIAVGGQQAGAVTAARNVDVAACGSCSGTIEAGGDASVEAFGDITSQVTAGGDVTLDTWSDIASNVQAGGSAWLSADGNLEATVTALAGGIDAETLGTAQVTATAQGSITLDALGAVSESTLTSTAGGVDLEVDDDATATIQACRDVSIFTNGDLNATVTTSDGDVEALALGSLEGSYTAGGDVEIGALKDITGASVSAAGYADLTSLAGASNVSVSGTLGASAWAGDDLSGEVDSSQGEVDVSAIGGINVTVHAGADALVEGLADVQANVTSTGTSVVAGLGSVSGLLVYKYPYEDITPLSRLTKLDSLSFLNTYRLKSVRGVAALQNMEYLGFFLCPKLTDITEVAELKQMKELAFDTCKNARPFDIVGSLKRLRSLDFSNCGAIGSIAALRDTPDLEEFLFSESTNVLDGDLSPMASLPKLRCHAFRDRKHYSHTSDYFDEHAGAGHGRGGPRKRFGTFGDPNYEPLTVRPASS